MMIVFVQLLIVRVTPVVEDMNAGKRRCKFSLRTTEHGEVWIGTKDVLVTSKLAEASKRSGPKKPKNFLVSEKQVQQKLLETDKY